MSGSDKAYEISDLQQGEAEILVRVARIYYEHGLNQQEIVDRVGLSRSRVSRLLTRAREAGIVQVTIIDLFKQEHELSAQLADRYGLKRVVVCPIPESSTKPYSGILARQAPAFLKR